MKKRSVSSTPARSAASTGAKGPHAAKSGAKDRVRSGTKSASAKSAATGGGAKKGGSRKKSSAKTAPAPVRSGVAAKASTAKGARGKSVPERGLKAKSVTAKGPARSGAKGTAAPKGAPTKATKTAATKTPSTKTATTKTAAKKTSTKKTAAKTTTTKTNPAKAEIPARSTAKTVTHKAPATKVPFGAYKGTKPYLFVSYSHKNMTEVFAVTKQLKEGRYRIWYDEGIEPGKEWPEVVGKALVGSTQLLVFMSRAAAVSRNVRNEINLAFSEGKKIVVVYLEKTRLTEGMRLQIGAVQFLNRFEMSGREFIEKLKSVLGNDLHG